MFTKFRISSREIHAKYGDEPMRLNCDSPLDSLNAVQAANEALKVEDGARILVTAGGGAPQGGQSPHYGRFLSQVSL